MTIAPPEVHGAVALRAEAAPPPEAEAELLIQVVSPGAPVPAWLADYAEAIAALGEGDRLAIPRAPRAGFRADTVLLAAIARPTRQAARRLGRRVGAEHRALAVFVCAGLPSDGPDSPAAAFAAGFSEGRYRFTRYRAGGPDAPAELRILGADPTGLAGLAADLEAAAIIEEGVRVSRDLTNTPARDLTPALLAEAAIREADRAGAEVRVFDEAWLEAERFAGLCAVGAGSVNPPRLVEVSYRGSAAAGIAPVVLVGKGVTFDSGGLSLKNASAMVEMKSDMAGAATALAVVCAIARLRPERAHVVALMPLAENLPGADALRPGDIIRHRNGLTTEVVNTDCEGRLVMSDVMSWAAERRPAAMLDIATLTYSTIAALGMDITSVIGTDAALVAAVCDAGERTGDPYWELPLWEPYRAQLDSAFADLRNEPVDGSSAGAITAALYLREFAGDTPWAHLDIGGTAYLDEEADDLQAGGTGVCVRSLIRMILDHPFTTQGDDR